MTPRASILALVGAWLAYSATAEAGQRLYDFEAVTRQSMARIGANPAARATAPRAASPSPPTYAQQSPPLLAPVAPPAVAQAEPARRSFLERTVAEFVVGGFLHDPGQDNNESNTWDFNAEIIFRAVTFAEPKNRILRFLAAPRPVVGGSVNDEGYTHTAYAAFDWTYPFESGVYLGGTFGLAYHTGTLHQATEECPPGGNCTLPGNRRYVDTGEVSLGTRILFRESLELGYRFATGHGLSLHASHISQGGIFDGDNDGMNFVGIRYSYALR
jgi:hypothetical protein